MTAIKINFKSFIYSKNISQSSNRINLQFNHFFFIICVNIPQIRVSIFFHLPFMLDIDRVAWIKLDGLGDYVPCISINSSRTSTCLILKIMVFLDSMLMDKEKVFFFF